MSPFAAWESFYVIIGTSAAALIGLQFVVIVLAAEISARASEQTTSAFGSPNIVHFCAALVNSAIVSAPWKRAASGGVAIALASLVGLAFTLSALRQARRQTVYKPVLEDWIWHFLIPLAAYCTLLIGSLIIPSLPGPALFAVGGASLGLMLVGIHNAWDSVTYIALSRRRPAEAAEPPSESDEDEH